MTVVKGRPPKDTRLKTFLFMLALREEMVARARRQSTQEATTAANRAVAEFWTESPGAWRKVKHDLTCMIDREHLALLLVSYSCAAIAKCHPRVSAGRIAWLLGNEFMQECAFLQHFGVDKTQAKMVAWNNARERHFGRLLIEELTDSCQLQGFAFLSLCFATWRELDLGAPAEAVSHLRPLILGASRSRKKRDRALLEFAISTASEWPAKNLRPTRAKQVRRESRKLIRDIARLV